MRNAATLIAKMRKPKSGYNKLSSEGQTGRSPSYSDGNQPRHQRHRNCLSCQEGGSLISTTSFKRVCLFSSLKTDLHMAVWWNWQTQGTCESPSGSLKGQHFPFAPKIPRSKQPCEFESRYRHQYIII